MEQIFTLFTIILALAFSVTCSDVFSRNDFPEGFVFGSGTSAYQWEGAVAEDGRTPSVWDTFSHSHYKDSADITCDGYHKYKEDVKLMVDTGLDAFRFSISWSRLRPNGRGPVNQKGLQFYKNLIQELVSHGIEPHVTLYHFDHPQYLEDEYGGWLNHRMIKDFTSYTDVCFREFGNHVKFWTLINEANIYSIGGYTDGLTPPGRCSFPGRSCVSGNSSIETYIVGHNILLAHASASRLYKQKYKDMQGGYVGFSLYFLGLIPSTSSEDDYIATERAKDFYTGWMLGPLIFGEYPDTMKRIVGSRLPVFSEEEAEQVKGSSDFIGVIHYYGANISNIKPKPLSGNPDFYSDMGVSVHLNLTAEQYPVAPWTMEVVLEYVKQSYGNPPVIILENGAPEKQLKQKDLTRIEYVQAYIGAVLKSVRNGSDTRGYFLWSFMDLFELFGGYENGFGLYSVNFSDPHRKRSPKLSAHWYSNFLKGKNVSLGYQGITDLQSNFSWSSFQDNVVSRNDFPDGFVFGSGTSAYQWEGAAAEDGRTPSVWDTFSLSHYKQNADVTCDGYHKYKEDVKLIVDTGLDAFRFSISWSRLIPNGRGPVNQKGLQFYKNLIQELVSHGIEPHVTLYHYDHPQSLEDEYGGWLNHRMIKDFTAYADVCFREFGNQVKFWTTINEANILSISGYTDGWTPPGRCSIPGRTCLSGNSSIDTYIVGHNLLLAHASASRLYKQKYKDMQGGSVGFCLSFMGLIPSTSSEDDYIATQRAKDFYIGWMLGPLIFGEYPDTMKITVGSRLPVFSEEEAEQVKGSSDFIGMIHYYGATVTNIKPKPSLSGSLDFYSDMGASVQLLTNITAHEAKYPVAPWTMEAVLEYVKQSYGNPPVYILENGAPEKQLKQKDTTRVEYLHAYIGAVLKSLRNGSDTRGYFVWSFMDLFELFGGYEKGFGLYYVNFSDPHRKRSPKLSAHWYSNFLKGKKASLGYQGIADLQSNFSSSS